MPSHAHMDVQTDMRPLHNSSAEDQVVSTIQKSRKKLIKVRPKTQSLDANPSHSPAVANQAKGETESLLLRRTLREDHLTLDGDCRDSGSQDPSLNRLDGSTDFKSRREIEWNMKRNVRGFWPLVAHFILSVLLTIAVFIFVDGRMFYLTSRRPVINDADGSILHADYRLLQSDVTTIISAAQTVIRFVGGSWTAATIRRCIFILLEKEGLSLSNASWMLTWGLPARFKHARVATLFPIWIILLSSVPSQLSSPLLTGSITWKPSYTLMHGQKQLSGIASVGADQPSLGTQLRIYQETVGARIYIRAMRFSYRAWGANTNLSVTSPMRRVIASAESLPVSSILWNVTLPAFSIQSLQWIEDPATEIDPRNLTAFLNSRTYFSPFTNDPSVPAFALLPSPTQGNITDWGPRNPTSQFPKLNKVSETRLLAVFFTRSRMADSPSKCPQDSMLYGPIPPHVGILPVGESECFLFARVTYRAGVVKCTNCQIVAPLAVEAGIDVVTSEFQEDPMVSDALDLVPRFSSDILAVNMSIPSELDINFFITEVLSRSYQACWTALTEELMFPPSLSTGVDIAITSIQADVTRWRVYAWLASNLLLTLSGIVFWLLQSACQKPMIINSEIAMLLIDSSDVLQDDHRHLDDLFILSPEDTAQVGLLRLKNNLSGRRMLTGNN